MTAHEAMGDDVGDGLYREAPTPMITRGSGMLRPNMNAGAPTFPISIS
jgi:hypothetical protein